MKLEGKWALVTGSSRGVGYRVAGALAREGCRMILHARSLKATDQLAAELKEAGVEVFQVQAELSKSEDLEALIARVKDITEDTLDILYNNAAIMTPYLSVYNVPVEDYQLSFMVNSIAPIKLSDAFLPSMVKRGWGRVVNVTSGIANEPELMAYSCSKAALDRYVRDMIPTLKDSDVLMNLVDPGWLRTDLGGPNAPNDPDSVLPGALVPVLMDKDKGSGQIYCAQDYAG